MAAKKKYPQKDRGKAVEELFTKIEEGTKAVYDSERYKEMLTCMAKFPSYSVRNNILIAMQRPEASLVCGYKSWETKFNRHVKKGEKGIVILGFTPQKIKSEKDKRDEMGFVVYNEKGEPEKEEIETLIPRFKPMYVFDVSQTEGEPLPTIYNGALEGSVERYDAIQEALVELSPVPIRFEDFDRNAMGYYNNREKEIVIKEGLSELQTLKTMVHEIAHSQMHSVRVGEDGYIPLSKETKEVEAESVAFICCAYLGLDTSDYSFPYIAGWAGDKELKILHESLERIRTQAVANIEVLDEHLKDLTVEQTKDTFTIYQVTEDARNFLFTDLAHLQARRLSVDPNNYREVYTGTLEADDDLEKLYERFNIGEKPEGYMGHSMSVSDVVVLHQGGEDTAYFCDSFGFSEVPEFLSPPEKHQEKTQQPLTLAQRLSAAKVSLGDNASVALPSPTKEQSL